MLRNAIWKKTTSIGDVKKMNKKIFISGGAQRIGKALVYHFHKKGWDIIFQYRSSKQQSDKITDELNKKRSKSCMALQCDFDNKESSLLSKSH